MNEYYAYVKERAADERNEYRKECMQKTGLNERQIDELQNEWWAIKEIMAWSPVLSKSWILIRWNPKELIFSAPDL